MNKKRVCVFASSSNFLEEIYYEEVALLGNLLGQAGYDIVYGGSNLGLMWQCAKSGKCDGAKIFGVMPEKLHELLKEESENLCDELYITPDMRSRKAKLDEISDAVIALPGGFGTLEELAEMIVQKQLGYNTKPIVIFNINNFYNKLIEFFNQMVKEHFATDTTTDLYYVAQTAEEVIDYLASYKPVERKIDKISIYKR